MKILNSDSFLVQKDRKTRICPETSKKGSIFKVQNKIISKLMKEKEKNFKEIIPTNKNNLLHILSINLLKHIITNKVIRRSLINSTNCNKDLSRLIIHLNEDLVIIILIENKTNINRITIVKMVISINLIKTLISFLIQMLLRTLKLIPVSERVITKKKLKIVWITKSCLSRIFILK